MSVDYSCSFGAGPVTPPDFSFEGALNRASYHMDHGRSDSRASIFSHGSSPESVDTQLTSPARSPIRHHGPLLLPKIRDQDQAIPSPPRRARKLPSSRSQTIQSTASFPPFHTRSYTNPEPVVPFARPDWFPSHARPMSTLCSSLAVTARHDTSSIGGERRASSADLLDPQMLGRNGFPSYRPMASYTPSATHGRSETFSPASFSMPPRAPSPQPPGIGLDETTLSPVVDGASSSMMAYLTSPNPAPALVRQLHLHVRDGHSKHFWWDVRQIRPWTAFNATSIAAIPGLEALLHIQVPSATLPTPPRTSSQPETEAELRRIYSAFYGTKLNAALSLTLGRRHLAMRAAPKSSTPGAEPSFVSNYADDAAPLLGHGRPGQGRVVGLVRSFDRWNTGMRVEGAQRRVEYLRGLAHLHRCMREHGCRYGFLLTEIELVVVRNGADAVPHFGYLEIQTVPLAAASPAPAPAPAPAAYAYASAEHSFGLEGELDEPVVPERPQRMTALLALWYLHMLARDDVLPGQPGWSSDIGAPAEGTRRKCLPKDEWIPEPQLAEKREAKRARGWVWPEEPVGRKELGRRGVRYNNC